MAYSQQALIAGIDPILDLGLAATPVAKTKNPYRSGWQTEEARTREQIINAIINGESCFSTAKNKWYTGKAYGVGVRTGEVSGGVVGIDVDDSENLLAHVSQGDLPKTVEWTSGKKGCRGLLYQLPDDVRLKCRNFTRKPLNEWDGVKSEGADLDIRYNRQQQVLPPSYHPTTGVYRWINSPVDTPIAIAPKWLCDLIVYFADADERLKEEKEKQRIEQAERKRQRRLQKIANGSAKTLSGSLSDLLDEAKSSLHWRDVYDISTTSEDGGKIKAYCPIHGGKSGTGFQVDTHTGAWFCHGCQEGGHFVDYLTFIDGLGTGLKGTVIAPYVRKLIELAGFTQEEIKKATEKELTAEQKEAQRVKRRENWLKTYQFSGVPIKSEFVELSEFKILGLINAIRAGMGDGKTTAIVKVARALKWYEKIIFLGVNNTLLIQTGKKVSGLHFKQDDPEFSKASNKTGAYLFCVQSLHRFTKEQLEGAIIVLDEATAIVREIVDGSTISSRSLEEQKLIVDNWHYLLGTSKGIIALDGYLNDRTMAYIHQTAPHLTPVKRMKPSKPKTPINFHLGAIQEGEFKSKNFTPILKNIVETLVQGGKIAIASDSQKTCEALDILLSDKGYKGLRIDGTTVPEEYIKEILKDPNADILREQYHYLIYSPSAMSGFDFNLENYFSTQFNLFYGVLSADLLAQMLWRVRYCPERHLWVNEIGVGEGGFFTPKAVERAIGGTLRQFSKDALDDNFDDIAERLSNDLDSRQAYWERAKRNYERANLRECLKALLELNGSPIIECCEEIEDEDQELAHLKAIKKQLKDEFAIATFEAEDIDADEFQEKKEKQTKENKPKLTRFKIKQQLPGITEDPIWSPEFIRWYLSNTDSRHQARRWWLYQNIEALKSDSVERFKKRNKFRPYQFRSYLSDVLALKDLGIIELFSTPRAMDDPEVLKCIEKWNGSQIILDRLSQKRVSPKSPIYAFKWILGLFGLNLKSTGLKRGPEGAQRHYEIATDHQDGDEWQSVWRSIAESQTQRALEVGYNVENECNKPPGFYINSGKFVTPNVCIENRPAAVPRPLPLRNGMKDSALEWFNYLLSKNPHIGALTPPDDIRGVLEKCFLLAAECKDDTAVTQFAQYF